MGEFLKTAAAVVVGVAIAHAAIWVVTPKRTSFEIREQMYRGTKMFWVYRKGYLTDTLIGGASSIQGAREKLKGERASGDERVVETIP